MMEWTDRHYRYFMRQITRHTLLYTEMKTSGAVLYGDRQNILGFSVEEKPLALQIGGDDPSEMAQCAQIAEDFGYDEVNINVGCPSGRVQKGNFGACLMAHPEVVARCVEAMRNCASIPVTVKHRIGIDGLEAYENLANFVRIVSGAGCNRFSVHARIAVLGGLNPKGNRTIPPLRYADVYRLKEDFPHLAIEINGGIKSIEDITRHLPKVDGVMVGRAAYENPFLFAEVDRQFFNATALPTTRREVVQKMVPYIEEWQSQGVYPNRITRHMLGLFAHRRGAKAWRRYLSENAHKPGTGSDILLEARQQIPDEVLDERALIQLSEEQPEQAVQESEMRS